MCEVRSKGKITKNQKKRSHHKNTDHKNTKFPRKKRYSAQQQQEMNCDEPHLTPNEKMQPIQWTERPTGALVAAGSLWPIFTSQPNPPV